MSNQEIDKDRDQLVTNHQLFLLSVSLKRRRGLTPVEARELSSKELNFCTVCYATDGWPLCDHCTEIKSDLSVDDN